MALTLFVLAAPSLARPVYSAAIPGDSRVVYHLAWVRPGSLLRSGAVVVDGNHLAGDAPSDKADVKRIYGALQRQYRVAAVVNLRAESAEDAEAAQALGMRYLRLAMVDGQAPSPEQVRQFFAFLAAERARRHVVLYHCAGGIGRAGLMSALIRLQEGWSVKDAVAEMFQMGLSYNQAAEHLPALNAFASALGKAPYYPPDWPYGRACRFDYRAIAAQLPKVF